MHWRLETATHSGDNDPPPPKANGQAALLKRPKSQTQLKHLTLVAMLQPLNTVYSIALVAANH
jgi:hypothetical protein